MKFNMFLGFFIVVCILLFVFAFCNGGKYSWNHMDNNYIQSLVCDGNVTSRLSAFGTNEDWWEDARNHDIQVKINKKYFIAMDSITVTYRKNNNLKSFLQGIDNLQNVKKYKFCKYCKN